MMRILCGGALVLYPNAHPFSTNPSPIRSRPKFPSPRRLASVLLVRKRSVDCAVAHREDSLIRAAHIEPRSER